MKKNLAIVGYGGQGAWHANWAMKSDVVSLAGIYDIRQCRMDAAVANGIHTYSSLEELVSDPKVDIVLCATPNDVHRDIVISALDHGKHAICEKPVALKVEDFDMMVSRGVQPWVGASVKNAETVDEAIARGAYLITCNNPDEILALLRERGYHD